MTIDDVVLELRWLQKINKKILETDAKEIDADSAWIKHWESVTQALDIAIDTARKYQMYQLDYEARLKADMVAMLTDLSMEIGEIEDGYTEFDEENKRSLTMIPLESVDRLIQQKINSLKGE